MKNNIKFFLFLIIFSLIYALVPIPMLNEKNEALNYFINQYTLSFVYFPIGIIASAVISFFRVNDVYVTNNKKIILYELLYQVTIIQFILWIVWTLLSICLLFLYSIPMEQSTIIHLAIVYSYILLDQLIFSLMYLNVWLLLKNKGMALVTLFIVNLILFSFSVSKVPILIYDFATETSIIRLLSKLIILLGIILLELIILMKIVSKKEF